MSKLKQLVADQQRELRPVRSETAELRNLASGSVNNWSQPQQPTQLPIWAASNPHEAARFHVVGSPHQQSQQYQQAWQPTENADTAGPPSGPPPNNGRRHWNQKQHRGGRVGRDCCRFCGQSGHWQRDCAQRRMSETTTSSSGSPGYQQANVGIVTTHTHQLESYMDIYANGIHCEALIDSGCDRSVISYAMVAKARLQPASVQLFAANGTEISVCGAVRLRFTIGDVPLYADLLVSKDISELILGIDWLKSNRCHWLFEQATLVINGMPVRLKHRPSRACVRRIFVRDRVVVPPICK